MIDNPPPTGPKIVVCAEFVSIFDIRSPGSTASMATMCAHYVWVSKEAREFMKTEEVIEVICMSCLLEHPEYVSEMGEIPQIREAMKAEGYSDKVIDKAKADMEKLVEIARLRKGI